ncbi:PREDICTED: MKI67 FHA domain-interacting nucleolar phosphoprotein-like [Vollenhovia emeryi]|uniref:MKI67 FHA domain-interacting nucleolar phosphoprotein-like n=1 Tax=Vollenhovia emeryi TaxID=411798 RepID=UPI0005F47E7E|nr:PREDICTED: MKI67 FHA domain-interacting nucleolar phosphoprotein-like [Vollenhovia emeryi]
MKVRREDATSRKSLPRKAAESKQRMKPKAGASLEKAVKNVKQVFKKKRAEAKAAKKKETRLVKPKCKQFKAQNLRPRGVVYVGHIPHGFYEEQMEDYFKQFGNITRVRVARSKRTGKSRGYGYVEFLHPQVARIAADTMNNYLMCGRLLKATYIPPEKQHFGFFSGENWTADKYPKLKNRKEVTLSRNSLQSAEDHVRYAQSSLSKLSALENKLKDKGISMKFQPVDVPET